METRKVQRTGDMHYVYLPTAWVKEHNIDSSSQVSLNMNPDGSLVVSPQLTERKTKSLKLSTKATNEQIIHKLLVACYINPLSSFEIDLSKELNYTKLLEQKKLISLEAVELDKKKITCEGAIATGNPISFLKTMLRKIKNMILVMKTNYNKELIERYEEEIDRLKLLSDKSTISALTYHAQTQRKTIDLYYISLITKDLESLVDHLICIPKTQTKFLTTIETIIDKLKEILEAEEKDRSLKVTVDATIDLANLVIDLPKVPDTEYDKKRIHGLLVKISEVMIDWAITNQID